MNDAPTLDLNGTESGTGSSIVFTENDPATALAPNAVFADDSESFAGATLTVSISEGGTGDDQLVLIGSPGGSVNDEGNLSIYDAPNETYILVATYTGGADPGTPLVVTFTEAATAEFVQDVLRAIGFTNGSETPAAGERSVGFAFTDAEGATSAETVGVVDVVPVEDPAVALDDSVAAREDQILQGSVLLDNGNGPDFSTEGAKFDLIAVDGDAALVGQEIKLKSGALLRINEDGTFSYDPNGSFGYLISPDKALATGAWFETPVETVTYTITGGGTATLTITVAGVDSDDDELRGTPDHDTITGTDRGDLFVLSDGGNERVNGAGGNDLFRFGDTFDAADRVDGDAGIDELLLSGGTDVILGAETLLHVERITLGGGASYRLVTDSATVADGASLLVDGSRLADGDSLDLDGSAETSGAFVIVGGGGADDILTGGGNDLIAGNGGSNRLDGGGGIDTVSYALAAGRVTADLSANAASDNGAGGADDLLNIERLIGSAQGDTLTGNELANRLDGGAGEDALAGGGGNDVYVVDDSDDAVTEAAAGGTDRVESSASFVLGADIENLDLTGRAAIDGTGNGLANILIGNGAANRLDGGAGADTMRGGKGDDTYIVDDSGDRVVEERSGGLDRVESSISYALGTGLEALVLSGDGAIEGTGNSLANRIAGNAAANRIDGGAGADTMAGGLGDDTYVVDDRADRIIELARGGTDTVESSVSYALGSGVNDLVLTGTAANGTGNDAGNAITGNDSANILRGKSGNDFLSGGGGTDRLYGGVGNDRLDGGGGSDGFYFDTRLNAVSNVDRIVGFSVADDTIFLDRSVFSKIVAGTLNPAAFQRGAAAADAAHRIVYDAATGEIFYDRDGSGAAAQILFARLDPGLALTSADFVAFG